ncbi:MAG: hypothetical protein K8S98_16355 [Planctomycetes bacterium]|nr:hypothetical protein [Planctomycetota bacterium]
MKRYAWICLVGLTASCNLPRAQRSNAASTGVVRALGVDADFEDAVVGVLPDGWRVAETNGAGTPATWKVDQEGEGKDANRFVRLAETKNAGATFNVLLSKSEIAADFELSVKLRADSGAEDQGGGVVWRAQGANDYYVARWNPLEKNLRTYKVEHGRRSMLSSVDVDANVKDWHELAVRARGDEFEISFGTKRVAIVDDATFLGDGHFGLWTKADAATSFDDLHVDWKEETAR